MRVPLLAALAAVLVAAGPVSPAAPPAAEPSTTAVLFENVRVFEGRSSALSAPANVLVVGNAIQSISTGPVAAPPGATVTRIAGGGRTLMPRLIDNHSAYDPLDVAQYTLDEIKAAVEAADHWNTYVTAHAYTTKAVRRAVEAGVKCIDHGQLLDEETVKLLAEKGTWLSLQALDPAPPTASAATQAKKPAVVDGTDRALKWALKHGVKLAWGTDFLFTPANHKNQTADIVKLKQWMPPAQVLRLGGVEADALADLLLVDGDPIANLELLRDPGRSFVVIVKDGKVYKNTLR